MTNDSQIQNIDLYLPGNLGYVIDPQGKRRPILQIYKKHDGSTTITIGTAAICPLKCSYEIEEKALTINNEQKNTLRIRSPE